MKNIIIKLNKTDERGKLHIWMATIKDNTVIIEYGIHLGKIRREEKTYLEGKNIGRSNETTPEEQCIRDTIVKARKKIEQGYTVVQGSEEINVNKAKTVVDSNLDIPKPMLAHKLQEHMSKFEMQDYVWLQPKLDGNRALINVNTGEIYSRSRKLIISCPHISEDVKAFKDTGIMWIDGELYSHELSFNEIQSIIRKSKNIDFEQSKKIYFNMFDFISRKSQDERMIYLNEMNKNIPSRKYIHIVESYKVEANMNEILKYHQNFVNDGYEGTMVRFCNGGYEQKRSYTIFKYKDFEDAEFIIIGFMCEKNMPDKLGSVILELENGDQFNARPAMTEEEREELWENQDYYIGKMATIKFQGVDEKTGIPRFPVLKAIREEE